MENILDRFYDGEQFDFCGYPIVAMAEAVNGKIAIVYRARGNIHIPAYSNKQGRCKTLDENDEVVDFQAVTKAGEFNQ